MIEYQNIVTRMLGADSFPYRNITINQMVYKQAVFALNAFFFIGLQEAYEISVELLIRELGLFDKMSLNPIKKERDQSNPKLDFEKNNIKNNATLIERTKLLNRFDIELYKLSVEIFCSKIIKYPDLLKKLHTTTKVKCDINN